MPLTTDPRRRLRRILEGNEHAYAEEPKVSVPVRELAALVHGPTVAVSDIVEREVRIAALNRSRAATRRKLGVVERRLAETRAELAAVEDVFYGAQRALAALRARRDEAGAHPVDDAELLRMIELGVAEPSTGKAHA